ncbi:MAG: hypothetical protein JST58_04480 [Bacteroidetes bacterium]|nr:hypothetical protein [Bacteroidota bacterium]
MTVIYPHNDNIRELLKDKSELVRNEGLNYLIPDWQKFADQYSDAEESLYEWLDDLDTRKIIDEILQILPYHDRIKIDVVLEPIDKKVIDKTFEINECVWGSNIQIQEKFDRQKNWYYFRLNQKIFDSEPGQFSKRM